jgi:hypothetical protein
MCRQRSAETLRVQGLAVRRRLILKHLPAKRVREETAAAIPLEPPCLLPDIRRERGFPARVPARVAQR